MEERQALALYDMEGGRVATVLCVRAERLSFPLQFCALEPLGLSLHC